MSNLKQACRIVLCKSVVSEGKELISNWAIRFQETHGFLFLIGQFDINSFPSLTMDLQSTISPDQILFRCAYHMIKMLQLFKHVRMSGSIILFHYYTPVEGFHIKSRNDINVSLINMDLPLK